MPEVKLGMGVYFLILIFSCQFITMLIRQIKISQAKCNFCMQWMILSIDVKFNINICDSCLGQGCQESNLRAISSKGELYQLYMVKQNSVIENQKSDRTIQNWFGDLGQEQQEVFEIADQPEKTQFLQQIDSYRNTEIKDILSKWNIFTSFLNEQQNLSNQQIKYLRAICSQKAADLKRLHQQFVIGAYEEAAKNNQEPCDGIRMPQSNCNNSQNRVIQLTSQIDVPKIKLSKVQDKQNVCIGKQNQGRNQVAMEQIKMRLPFQSPVREVLKQKDLNYLQVDSFESDLKRINETSLKKMVTSIKRHNTSFYEDNQSLDSNSESSSVYFTHSSIKSSRSESILNGLPKRLNTQQDKKFELIKSKICKYLQKNYESTSLGRLIFSVVFEAQKSTSLVGKSLQLVSYNLSYTDFRCYLEAIDWKGVEVLKLVKTKLSDDQFKILIHFIAFNKLQIKVLVLTSNKLTQTSIQHLFDQELEAVKQIYLGKNRINKGKVRNQITSLRNRYSLYL